MHLQLLEPGTSAAAKLPAAPSASSTGKGLNVPASFVSASTAAKRFREVSPLPF
jgi:hypothetical protein